MTQTSYVDALATNLLEVTSSLVNAANGRVVAEHLSWARTRRERARGLIGLPPMQPGSALIIDRAAQVHTFGVGAPIDVVFCSDSWHVLHVISPLARNRVSKWVRGSRFVVELREGRGSDLSPGDQLRLRSASVR